MAYIKNNWVDREGTTRYFETVDSDGAKIFTPDYTQITELGTPVNADNMNHIEEGIAAGSFTKYDTKATYALNDLVTVIEDGAPAIYKSLQDNNIGNALSDSAYWEKISLGGGGGLEIGDIGFTQMAIDESKGKRRILNGQLIIQDQYVQFTQIVKDSVALNSDLACTEAEWQTEVTMNTFGLCGKFVIDDEGGTIRLPKYPNYFIAGLANIAPVVGNRMALGLIGGADGNIGGGLVYTSEGFGVRTGMYGQPLATKYGSGEFAINYTSGVTDDPTKSGIEAQIKQEQIKGTYFIQVATGAETEDNIINEIELNNPFSLLDYKYSEYELNNISWLRSNGQYNSKAIYPAVYELLLKIYNGVETKAGVSVKLSTGSYTDYDFVLNTAEETFRLPIKVKLASGKAVVGNGITLGLTNGTQNGGLYLSGNGGGALVPTTNAYGVSISSGTSLSVSYNIPSIVGVSTDPAKSGIELSDSDLYLYFYVGETVQNANLINAGRIEETLADKLDRSAVKAYITQTYVSGTSGYRIWSADSTGKRYCEQWGYIASVTLQASVTITLLKTFNSTDYRVFCTGDAPKQASDDGSGNVHTKTTSSFNLFNSSSNAVGYYWEAKGYIN